MPYATVSLTSASTTTSTPVALNWIGGKPTTVSLSFSSSLQVADTTIQYTLDDIQRVSSASVQWLPVTSSAGSSTVAHYATTTYFDTGVTLSFLNPIAAVRLGSTAISSGTVYLRVLQGEGW